jgi:uncharacterized protein
MPFNPRALQALSLTLLLATASAAGAADGLADRIQAGDRAAALEMIRAGADVNTAQGDGTTPLHWAVYKVDAALVAELLKRGAKVDAVNAYGSSPLAEAVKIADAGLVKALLDAGADVEARNTDGQTALMLAAREGSLAVAQLLVERGADVNAKETWRGQTALMWAADGNFPEVAELLIKSGADVHARALANEWAAQITSEPRAQYRPTGGLTPLLYAARSGCSRCVRAMLTAGADIDQPNPDGVTPLMVAIDNSHHDTARLLLTEGANPHHWDWWGRTALYVAVDISTNRRAREPTTPSETSAHDVIRLLLEAKVSPNSQLNMHRPNRGGNQSRFADDLLTTGATPLLRAALGRDVETVRMLLEHGAAVDLPNVMGITPFMAASGFGGARGGVVVGAVASEGDVQARVIETLELLRAAGADVNASIVDSYSKTGRIARQSSLTDREGQTPLFAAAGFGWTRVVTYLLENGARVDVKDAHGKTPLDAATGNGGGRGNNGSPEVAELLRSAPRS